MLLLWNRNTQKWRGKIFESVLVNNVASTLGIQSAVLCTGASLVFGLIIAICYCLSGKSTKGFCVSLVVLPALVQTVIMLVNGNLGTGVAIVGAFSLIRFRSIPGTSREITFVFFAMVAGLAAGMGYLTYGVFVCLFVGVVVVFLALLPVHGKEERMQTLRITIYEDLDYTTIFDDLFEEYLKRYELEMVKTTNMGSMYQITYRIEQKDRKREKEFIDELRCRNGNLTIVCGREVQPLEQL